MPLTVGAVHNCFSKTENLPCDDHTLTQTLAQEDGLTRGHDSRVAKYPGSIRTKWAPCFLMTQFTHRSFNSTSRSESFQENTGSSSRLIRLRQNRGRQRACHKNK